MSTTKIEKSETGYDGFGSEQRIGKPRIAMGNDVELSLESVAVVFIRADGGMCLFDPLKGNQPFVFKPQQAWDGLKKGARHLCNGLVYDWTSWQLRSDEKSENFSTLAEVLGLPSLWTKNESFPGGQARADRSSDARGIRRSVNYSGGHAGFGENIDIFKLDFQFIHAILKACFKDGSTYRCRKAA